MVYNFLIGLKTTYFDVFSILADSELHIFTASRTQNYIFTMLDGLRTTYCGLRTTYLPVENSVLNKAKQTIFAFTDSELHIDGFKTTYFDHFADSKLHIADSKLSDFDTIAHKPCGKACILLKEHTLAPFYICGKYSELS